MGMSINTNAGAEVAAVAAQRAAAMMDEAMLRLSTGKRINSAKDDAAGLAVATRMAKEWHRTRPRPRSGTQNLRSKGTVVPRHAVARGH